MIKPYQLTQHVITYVRMVSGWIALGRHVEERRALVSSGYKVLGHLRALPPVFAKPWRRVRGVRVHASLDIGADVRAGHDTKKQVVLSMGLKKLDRKDAGRDE
jgi:hypothetical protein